MPGARVGHCGTKNRHGWYAKRGAHVRQARVYPDQQARVRGFALDLSTGGPDSEDAAFGRAA